MDELELCISMWMNLKTILLSVESKLHTDTYYMKTFVKI